MKKIIIILLFVLFSCETNYKRNFEINKRTPPITIVAMDTTINSVVFKDGDEGVFTIYDNATTIAIINSKEVGDTIRPTKKTAIKF